MKFVEQNDANLCQRAVILQPAQQNALGDKADAGAQAGLVIKTDLIADFRAELHIAFPSHTRRDRACSDPSWLEHDDFLVPGQPGIQKHLRHLRGFPRTRGGNQHESIAGTERPDDRFMDLPDGKGGLHAIAPASAGKLPC